MVKRTVLRLLLCLLPFSGFAQNAPFAESDPIISMMDSLMNARLFESTQFTTDTARLNKKNYARDFVPTFDELVYEARLAKLDAASPFDLIYNQHVRGYIDLYSVRKRDIVSRMLGLAQVYFPLFEQRLDKYNLPLELKYLAIVESALNPNAVSRSGATGLWQFMYWTGKIYGLDVTSYYDERRDPFKATEAACRYFTDLYKMFGDWQMVLAAYNGGPGTLNKAIRRSGGKKTYWEVRPYLPLETQGYVPAFIAVNYVMNYSSQHNLYPISPKKEFFMTDTVSIKKHVSFAQVSSVLGIPMEDLAYLNPAYKNLIIPFDGQNPHHLCLPANKVGTFLSKENEIYAFLTPQQRLDSIMKADFANYEVKESKQTYVVKRGESVYGIARKFDCSVAELKKWNKMRNNSVHPGKKLTVMVKTKVPVQQSAFASNKKTEAKPAEKAAEKTETDTVDSEATAAAPEKEATARVEKKPETKKPKVIMYTVQPGDTLWIIANRYNGVTVEELKRLNGISNSKGLKVGSKIKVHLEG